MSLGLNSKLKGSSNLVLTVLIDQLLEGVVL